MHQRSSESTTAQAELVFEQRHSISVQESISSEIVPIRSIDQLYLQAITLAPFLSRLTQKCASGSVTPVTPPNATLPVGDISSSSSSCTS
jgi:hypothetical protein